MKYLPWFLLAACATNFSLDEQALVACETSADCPGPWVCDPALQLCVKSLVTTPSVRLGAFSRQLGDIPIVMTVVDGDDTSVHVAVEYDRGNGFQPAVEADVPASSKGVTSTLMWNAASALGPGYAPSMRLRVTPTGGEAVESETFAFGNDAPVIEQVSLGALVHDNAIVQFSVSDTAGDPVDIVLFEVDVGGGYQAFAADDMIVPSGSIAALPPGTHTFTWASRLTSVVDAQNARVRLTVRDAYSNSAPVASGPFRLLNQTAPVIANLRAPAAPFGRATGPLGLLYELSDDNADLASVTFEYSLDGGLSFLPCIEYAQPESDGTADLSPGTHVFIWDAASVSWRAQDLVTVVRATPSQPGLTGAPVLLTLSNGVGPPMLAPYARPTLVHSVGGGGISSGRHAFADFNGDGRTDVAVEDGGVEYAAIQQVGCPTTNCFANPPPLTQTPGAVMAFAPADFDEDGFADLLTVRAGSVSLRMGDATGIAFPDTIVAVGITGSLGIAVASDLDKDGHADLVLERDGGLSAYFGDGTAHFSAPLVAATGAFTSLQKGKTKLWARTSTALVSIDVSADRSFATQVHPFPASTLTAVGDIDGDGEDDIVSLVPGSPLFAITLASGVAEFSAGSASAIMNGFAVGDFNGDGLGDIAFSESFLTFTSIWLRLNIGRQASGAFGFSQPTLLSNNSSDARRLFSQDFDQDGRDDLFGSDGNGGFQVLMSNTLGVVGAGAMRQDNYWPGTANYVSAALSDVDANGVGDLLLNASTRIELWRIPGERGVSSGRLVGPEVVETCICNDVKGGDSNGDGIGDVWFNDSGTGYLRLGRGDGTFGPRSQADTTTLTGLPSAAGGSPFSNLDADLDGDGLADRFFVTNGNYVLEIYQGTGDNAWAASPAVTYPVYDIIDNYLFLADLNKDGLIDAITSTRRNSKSQLNVLIGQQEALFGQRAFQAKPVTSALPRRGQHGASTVSGEARVNLHIARGIVGKPNAAFTRFTAPYQVYSRPRVDLWLDLPIIASYDDTAALAANVVVYQKVDDAWQALSDFSIQLDNHGKRFVRVRTTQMGIVQAFVAP